MRCTDEERREVARKMRELAAMDGPYHSLDAAPYANLCGTVKVKPGVGRCFPYCADVLIYLADLLDSDSTKVDGAGA